jgi:hydroxymethylglutaryl-CoA synthase
MKEEDHMDIGITAYGVHIPRYRMDRKVIYQAMAWFNPAGLQGEKAVANYDEDSITMAVTASADCLNGAGAEAIYFATTTPPYREGDGAAIIGTALAFPPHIRTADFAGSLKSGTSALLTACDTVRGGGAESILVCASETRLGRPGTAQEMMLGDGAAAVTVGKEGVIAGLKGSYSLSYDFPDYRRLPSDTYVHAVEERFIREEGYGKFVPEAISGLLKKYQVTAQDFAKIAFPCLNVAQYGAIGKKLGFQPEQMQAPLLTSVGEMGAASPLVLLAAMLDEAKPGDNLLVAGFGNGAEVLWFTATDRIGEAKMRGKVGRSFAGKRALASYEKYLVFRGILPVDSTNLLADNPITQLPGIWRERKSILGLWGSKCTRCETPHYPPQNICVNPECGAVNEMAEYNFSRKRAKLFSYTVDNISFTLNPPFIFGVVDFDGGGRFVFQLTDCEADEVSVGMPVEMRLRKKYDDISKGVEGYFWKAVPAAQG